MAEENKDLGDKAEDAFDAAKDTSKNLENKASEKLESAKEATKEIADDIKEKAGELGEKAGETFDDAKEATKEFAEDAKEAATELASDAKKAANEFTESAKEVFNTNSGENKKILAGILAILVGAFGVHKFILGYQKEGIIMAAVGVLGWFACGIPTTIVAVIGLIEGIIYLTKTDEEFMKTYQIGRKPWF